MALSSRLQSARPRKSQALEEAARITSLIRIRATILHTSAKFFLTTFTQSKLSCPAILIKVGQPTLIKVIKIIPQRQTQKAISWVILDFRPLDH